MYWFTSDEHFGHYNILKYCQRNFSSIEEMDDTLIKNHNEVVKDGDIVVHAGDFTLAKREIAEQYIKRLNGTHVFLIGSHDYWMGKKNPTIWERKIEGKYITVCHYAMRRWPKSHYGAWHLYGHSHGNLEPFGKSYDIGVDNNNYYPVSFEQLKQIMARLKEN